MPKKISTGKKVFVLKVIIHLAALFPLINLYYLAFNDQLGADPVQRVIHFTGIGAFNLLLITLLVSPCAKFFKQGYLMQVRRLLGLYVFLYALMHLLNFIAFDLQFAWPLFLNEVIKRPYITIGMAAFVLIFSLTVTSHNTLRRKMGGNWQTLHNAIYLVVVLVAIHFYWSVKSSLFSPVIYCLLTALIIGFRHKKIKSILSLCFAKN